MKKALSLILAIMMLVSAIPAAYATTAHTNGTQVEYNAEADNDGDGQPDNVESYTVTVPAKLAPGDEGNVIAAGTWASNRKLNVTLKENTVTLTNTISGADEKVLDLTFENIALVGSNTTAVTETKPVSVADISAALFGTWKGVFEYNVEMVDYVVDNSLMNATFSGRKDYAYGFDEKFDNKTQTTTTYVTGWTFDYDQSFDAVQLGEIKTYKFLVICDGVEYELETETYTWYDDLNDNTQWTTTLGDASKYVLSGDDYVPNESDYPFLIAFGPTPVIAFDDTAEHTLIVYAK